VDVWVWTGDPDRSGGKTLCGGKTGADGKVGPRLFAANPPPLRKPVLYFSCTHEGFVPFFGSYGDRALRGEKLILVHLRPEPE
jgi:hypothetical protein